jgi:MazG family protein
MPELRDELGDLLFQVVFYAQMAKEAGHFDFSNVVEAIVDKLTRRHPHVFGDAQVGSAEQQTAEWEKHKAAERAAKAGEAASSVLDGVSRALPALSRAVKLQRRAARVGFDWRMLTEVLEKVEEELEEVRVEILAGADRERLTHEIGDLLLAGSNLARFAGIDPETALREANGRFERRFRRIESWLAEQGKNPEQSSLTEMEQLWRRAKEEETHRS